MSLINKKHLESLLHANGVKPPTTDEEIRSVLISARFKDNEVETALMILREDTKSHETRVETLHNVFRSDKKLRPQEISDLLGVEVNIDDYAGEDTSRLQRDYRHVQILLSIILAMLIALGLIWFVMYNEKVGAFHPGMVESDTY